MDTHSVRMRCFYVSQISAGIKSEVCGPESFTPDHKPLLGEAPNLRGFYLGCGFNSAGIMLSGGCGEQLAQCIVNGSPTLGTS